MSMEIYLFSKPKCEHKCPDPFADKVKCVECKFYLDKSDAQKVEVFQEPYYGIAGWDDGERVIYFCPAHKKPYDRHIRWPSERFIKNNVEVSEKGKQI